WTTGMHGSTYGGNPLACAAALATFDLIENELAANAEKVGGVLLDGLRGLAASSQLIQEVRGMGLMIGIEFADHDTAAAVEDACFRRGLLVLGAGDSALRMSPPLVLREDQAEAGLRIFEEGLADVDGRGVPAAAAGGRELGDA